MKVDLSACEDIDPIDVLDHISKCWNLKEFSMTGMHGINDTDLMNIISAANKLEIVDLSSRTPFHVKMAESMIQSLPNLRKINFEIAEPTEEIIEWQSLVEKYPNVHFGVSIMRIFPHDGMSLVLQRQAENEEKDM